MFNKSTANPEQAKNPPTSRTTNLSQMKLKWSLSVLAATHIDFSWINFDLFMNE